MREMPKLTMEDELMKEKIKRVINRLYDDNDAASLHEVSHLLLQAMFHHKIAMYYFKEEALDNLANESCGF